MFRHILVPLDFTKKNSRALGLAFALAARSGARITLLHVIERIERIPPEELEAFYARLERRAAARIRPIATRLGRKHDRVRGEIILGSRLREIIGFAARHRVDLIVLSSHRVDPRAASPHSALSHEVAMLSPCPVLLVRDGHAAGAGRAARAS